MTRDQTAESFDTAIIDGLTAGWAAQSIYGQGEMLGLFDVSAIIEAVVLHEKLVLLFPNTLSKREEGFLDCAREAFSPLITAGLVEVQTYAKPEPLIYSEIDDEVVEKKAYAIDVEHDFAAWLLVQTAEFAVAERSSPGNTVVLPCQSAMFKMNKRVRLEHSICNLYLNYGKVRNLAQLARYASRGFDLTREESSDYWNLPIPPLCLDALKRCAEIENIWSISGDLWSEYSSIRSRHKLLALVRSDDTVSPAARAREIKKLQKEWLRMMSRWRTRVESFRAADTTSNLGQGSGLLGDLEGLDISILGEISLDPTAPLKWAHIMYKMYERVTGYWRLRKIHDSLEAYWKVNDFEIYTQFERLFHRPVTNQDHTNIVRIEAEEATYPTKAVFVDFFPD